jgi:hypothetical protein
LQVIGGEIETALGLFVVFFVLVVALMLLSTVNAFKRPASGAERMSQSAEALGFEFTVDPALNLYPAMSGERDGLGVNVWIEYPNTDDPSTYYRIDFAPSAGSPSFELRNRSWKDRLPGVSDDSTRWKQGEERFGKVRISGSDHAAISAHLNDGRRAAVTGLLKRWSEVEVTEKSIVVQSGKGVPKDPNEVLARIDELIGVVRELR